MKKILIFVSSGFSTRMGGFPKGLSLVNGKPVIVNAIDNAHSLYDDIYVVCNYKTKEHFETVLSDNKTENVKIRPIVTGKGDAESVLKSIELVKQEIGHDFDCTFCWGDAFFVTALPFTKILQADLEQSSSILVGCSVDDNPYAYFDIATQGGCLDLALIKKSYFKKRDGEVPVGMHDQCIFRCQSDVFLDCLELYRKELGYNGCDYQNSSTNEMGLLNSFTFFGSIGKDARLVLMPSKQVFSFNTVEELEKIAQTLKKAVRG